MEQPKLIPVPNKNKYAISWIYEYKDILIPACYEFDGASIPRLAKSFVQGSFWPKYIAAALVHDRLYDTHKKSRQEADRIFYDILIENGVGKIKAWSMYKSVQIFGWIAWRKRKK